jgi:hypothetical protein
MTSRPREGTYRRMDEPNVVYVPIDDPVSYLGKPPLDRRAVLSLFECYDNLRLSKVRQGTGSRIA